jgi:predicted Abi (CAAX) family protease
MIFLQLGASLWLLRTNQVGGNNPSIEPIAPTDFSIAVPKVKQSKRLHKAIN